MLGIVGNFLSIENEFSNTNYFLQFAIQQDWSKTKIFVAASSSWVICNVFMALNGKKSYLFCFIFVSSWDSKLLWSSTAGSLSFSPCNTNIWLCIFLSALGGVMF